MNEQDKLIAEQLKTLPPELQKAIESVPWKNSVKEIGNANGLNAAQLEPFEQETMFVIYGFENPRDYIRNLVREVGISDDQANTLANSVTDKILNPILDKSSGERSNVPEIAPEIHPSTQLTTNNQRPTTSEPVMILDKEAARRLTTNDKQPTTKQESPKVSLPDYRYDGGKDPYREPLK